MDADIKKILITLFLVILCGSILFAQNPVSGSSVQKNRYNLSQFGNETWDLIKQPTRWEGSDWLRLGVISVGSYLIMKTADEPIRNAALRNQQYFNSVPIKIGNMWGDWYPTVVLGSAFALHGWIDGNSTSRKIAFEIFQAGLYTELITQLVKHSFGRARPFNELGSTAFKPFSFLGWDWTSLPAGHTTWAFSLSTVLSRNAGPGWLKALAYLPAALTFIARIYQDHHWTSDNFVGAAIGYFVATWVVDQHEQKDLLVEVTSYFPLSITIPLN